VTRAEKAARIGRILDELHPHIEAPLDHVDPFTLLVAVLLSAQCTDERVNRVTPGLFARANTPDAMAKVPVAEIQHRIRSCGLAPSKAKAQAGASRLSIDDAYSWLMVLAILLLLAAIVSDWFVLRPRGERN